MLHILPSTCTCTCTIEKRLVVTLRISLYWLLVLQHQNAQLAEYQARHEAKKSRARHALVHSGNQHSPHPLVASGHPPPACSSYEMGETATVSGGNQVSTYTGRIFSNIDDGLLRCGRDQELVAF